MYYNIITPPVKSELQLTSSIRHWDDTRRLTDIYEPVGFAATPEEPGDYMSAFTTTEILLQHEDKCCSPAAGPDLDLHRIWVLIWSQWSALSPVHGYMNLCQSDRRDVMSLPALCETNPLLLDLQNYQEGPKNAEWVRDRVSQSL